MKKFDFKAFVIAVVLPLAVGALSAFLSRGGIQAFGSITKPALTPPAVVFPIVWTVLYILMGIASYLVYVSDAAYGTKRFALGVYAVQLFFNFFWSILFFGQGRYLLAFIWLFVMWLLIALTGLVFYAIDKRAGYLFIPYFLWVSFAGYLNLAIYLMN